MPLLGRTAVIQLGGTSIGYCKNVSVSIDAALLKEYYINASTPDQPAFLASGNKTFKVSVDKAYIDSTYATNVLNGTAVTIVVQPEGTGTGKPKITLSNVVFSSWKMSVDQAGIIGESMSGEATSIAWGTQ